MHNNILERKCTTLDLNKTEIFSPKLECFVPIRLVEIKMVVLERNFKSRQCIFTTSLLSPFRKGTREYMSM